MRVVASLPSQLYTTMRNVKRNVLLGFFFVGWDLCYNLQIHFTQREIWKSTVHERGGLPTFHFGTFVAAAAVGAERPVGRTFVGDRCGAVSRCTALTSMVLIQFHRLQQLRLSFCQILLKLFQPGLHVRLACVCHGS